MSNLRLPDGTIIHHSACGKTYEELPNGNLRRISMEEIGRRSAMATMTHKEEPLPHIHQWQRVLAAALADLHRAIADLMLPLHPPIPLPTARIFRFVETNDYLIQWPPRNDALQSGYEYLDVARLRAEGLSQNETWKISDDGGRQKCALAIIKYANERPRRVLRAHRRIQCATAWCHARREGQVKQSQAILVAQSAAIEALEAEEAYLALQGGKP